MKLSYNKSTRRFSESTKQFAHIGDILSEVKYHLPYDDKIRIQDYTRTQSTPKVREFIKDSWIIKVLQYPTSELINHCNPKAIYLMAAKGEYIFNPKEESFSPREYVAVVRITDQLDLNKCYADPEFEGQYDEIIKEFNCVPFIYAADRLPCSTLIDLKSRYHFESGRLKLSVSRDYDRFLLSRKYNIPESLDPIEGSGRYEGDITKSSYFDTIKTAVEVIKNDPKLNAYVNISVNDTGSMVSIQVINGMDRIKELLSPIPPEKISIDRDMIMIK